MDLEWRPSFGTGGRPQVSIMQVAVGGRVFLLDLPLLSQPTGGQASQAFCRLVSQLLSDPSITKLGKQSPRPPVGGCWGKARALSSGVHPTDGLPCRLWDGRGPSEPGCFLPHPGSCGEAAAGRPRPAAGA